MKTVLVVDDEPQLLRALQINLHAEGYNVVTAANGTAALHIASGQHLDVVVLDLGLPDMDGTRVIEGLRGWSRVPIIVLSARHGSDDKVKALDAGADDYVTKPFGLDELLARLRAVERRMDAPAADSVVEAAGFTVNLPGRKVMRNGAPVRLTPREWSILQLLVRNPGKLVTQQQVLTEVWGPAYSSETQYLRVYVGQLRRKLEADPANPRHILTEAGMGYRFEA